MPNPLTYSITGDFPNQVFDSAAFEQEIIASDTGVAAILSYVDRDDDDITIYFTTTPSGAQETIVDGVVANHQGDPVIPDDDAEAQAAFEEASNANYKTISYLNGLADQILIYSDPSKLQLIYTKDMTYTGGVLTTVTLTRNEDSAVFLKDLEYTGDVVTSVDITKQ